MQKRIIFTDILGTFIFNEHIRLLGKGSEKELEKKYKNLKKAEGKELEKILEFFKNKEFFDEFHKKNLELTKRSVKDSVKDDSLIIQAINNIDDIDKSINILVKRLREWYELYNPEFSNSIQNHEKFVELVLKKDKKELLKELKVNESMGADLKKDDLAPILNLAKKIEELSRLRKEQEAYLERLMNKLCPNVTALAGATIGAKLIGKAGSLKKLVLFPASTIQLLGAEKALFRHLKTGARPPKYGIVHEHSLVSQAKRSEQGKAARMLADKISIAVKVDYFKGEPIGDRLKKELEDKLRGGKK